MKVFWSRCGHGYGNFGDKLTPLFLDYLNVRYKWASPEEADLIGIGSLVEKIPADFGGVIWTPGCMFETTRKNCSSAEVLAIRGKQTLDRIECKNKAGVALGDGGLLCDLFYEPTGKKFKLGIIPHFADQQSTLISSFISDSAEVAIIDICGPTLEVIQRVGECEYILSSSLHGLILADSLGIPNQWLELGQGTVTGAGFKFRDYYSIFGLSDMQPVHLSREESLNQILANFAGYSRPGIEAIKAQLQRSLETLARRFGGNPSQTKSLGQLRDHETRGAQEFEDWNTNVRNAIVSLENLIPANERFLLIDDEQLRSEVKHAAAIPFLERHGEYWGAPENDEEGISELNRFRATGVGYLVVAWPAFWWIDSYPELFKWIHEHYTCLSRDSRLRVFKAKNG